MRTTRRKKRTPVITFDSLVNEFEKTYHVTEPWKDTLACMIATVVSVKTDAEPLWFFVVGPPGCGKTTLASCIGAFKEETFTASKFTGMFSGWKSEKREDEDAGLVPHIREKTLIGPDFTTILSMPPVLQEKVFGEMRSVFDGDASAFYGNDQHREYSGVRFGVLACVTDEIHKHNRTRLGERFLKVEMVDGDHDHSEAVRKAIDNTMAAVLGTDPDAVGGDEAAKEQLKKMTADYLRSLCKKRDEADGHLGKYVTGTPEFVEAINAIAPIVAMLRTKVDREKQDSEPLSRTRKEAGTRIAAQFAKLGVCLAFALGREETDEEVTRIVRKVALDTCKGYQQDVYLKLAETLEPRTKEQVAAQINVSAQTVYRTLRDMREIQIVQHCGQSNNSGRGGRNLHYWCLTDEARALAVAAGISPPIEEEEETPRPVRRRRRMVNA